MRDFFYGETDRTSHVIDGQNLAAQVKPSSGMARRLEPFMRKLRGKLPLCPWGSVLEPLDFRTLRAHPPARQIVVLERDAGFQKLRFNDRHDAWFPTDVTIGDEMWSEYLSVFWEHRANGHCYVASGTPVKAGDVCMDCGACEGFFVFQALAAGAAKVICLEPSPVMGECLRRTFQAEIEEGRVTVCHLAAGAFEGFANFCFDQSSPFGGHANASAGAGEETIGVTTISRLCAKLGLSRVDFIKMDIEGAEIQAVEGALPLLRRDHPRLAITTYHRAFDFAALQYLLASVGYRHIEAVGITTHGERIYRPVMLHAWS
jgi:FkbM family methyltransferase